MKMIQIKLVPFLENKNVQFICQIILGGTFIFASIDKIIHPLEFSRIILNYKLLPQNFIIVAGIIISWTELIFGIFLVLGIFIRKSAFVLSSLLLIFIFAISINLIRGLDINCGCFSTNPNEAGSSGILLILRDIIFLIPGILILFFNKKTNAS